MIRLFVEKMLPIQSKDGVLEFQLSLCGIFILIEVSNHFWPSCTQPAKQHPSPVTTAIATRSAPKTKGQTVQLRGLLLPPQFVFTGFSKSRLTVISVPLSEPGLRASIEQVRTSGAIRDRQLAGLS